MINQLKLARYISFLLCVLLFSACETRTAGIEGTGDKVGDQIAARGSVTKFGSIYVNGIHFNTDNTEFFIGDTNVSEDAIRQGMVVYVEGETNSGMSEIHANVVRFDYLVQGKIDGIQNISSSQRLITMLGYTVHLTEDAMMDDGVFDQLEPGNYIAVSGFFESTNSIRATRIDIPKEIDINTVTVTGPVATLDTTNFSLTVNEQVIDYSNAFFVSGNLSDLEEGINLKVKGYMNQDTKKIEASKVWVISKSGSHSITSSEEGLVSNYETMANFTVNGVRINAENAAVNGDKISTIKNGDRVTITGEIDQNNILVAKSVYIHYQSSSRVSGAVTHVDPATDTITVSGIEFRIDPLTNFEDLGEHPNRYFDFPNVSVGDQIDIFSQPSYNHYVAITLKRKPHASPNINIKGQIQQLPLDSQFYMIGILIDATSIDQYILSQLNLEDTVYVTGAYIGHKVFKAEEIFILKNKCTSHREEDCKNQLPFMGAGLPGIKTFNDMGGMFLDPKGPENDGSRQEFLDEPHKDLPGDMSRPVPQNMQH